MIQSATGMTSSAVLLCKFVLTLNSRPLKLLHYIVENCLENQGKSLFGDDSYYRILTLELPGLSKGKTVYGSRIN